MGRKHAAALAGVARAQSEESIREAQARRTSAEQERQLVSSFLGTREQVEGTGAFNVSPEVIKYTQRYQVDEQALGDAQNVVGRFDRSALNAAGGRDTANRANQLLQQAEDAARSGDTQTADRLFAQAQDIVGGLSSNSAFAFNLVGDPNAQARIRAGSNEARVVGRQLLRAQELGDPTSEEAQQLRSSLLNPALAAIDEGANNADRAVASERRQLDSQIRQRAASGGTGFSSRAQQASEAQAASAAAGERARIYSEAGSRKGLLIADIARYINDFTAQFQRNAVGLAQAWVNETAGVRDEFQGALDMLNSQASELAKTFYILNQPGPREKGQGFGSQLLGFLASQSNNLSSLGSITGGGAGGASVGATSGAGGAAGGAAAGGAASGAGGAAASGVGSAGASGVGSASGGFFSSIAQGFSSFFSDKRLKTDVQPMRWPGMPSHVQWYTYRFKDPERYGRGVQVGLMAEDVEKWLPKAVGERDGYKTVNYDMVMRELGVHRGAN